MNSLYKLNQKQKYYKTSSLYPAAFLFAKGMELVKVEKLGKTTKAVFVFCDCSQREDWLNAFQSCCDNSSEAMVDGRKLVIAIRTLKDKLYQDKF